MSTKEACPDKKAKAAILSALLLVLAAAPVACGGGDSPRRTGVPEVDAVVEAVLSGDQAALRGFVHYEPVACSTEPRIGDEPCRPGEPDGMLVDALEVADCEPHYIRPSGIDQALGYLLAGKPELYGVYQGSPATWLSGDYTAILSFDGPEPGQVLGMELLIGGREIVWIDFGCGQSPAQLAERLERSPTPAAIPTGG